MRRYTFKQIRDMFFEHHPQYQSERRYRKPQNKYSTDCRCAFMDFVDSIYKSGMITDRQRFLITLG